MPRAMTSIVSNGTCCPMPWAMKIAVASRRASALASAVPLTMGAATS